MQCLERKGLNFEYNLMYVPKGPIDNNSALIQLMAWRWTGDKLLSGQMMT